MKKTTLALGAALLLVVAGGSAIAAGLGDQLCEGVTLTEEEKIGLEPLLARYYAANGTKASLASAIKSGVDKGCRGQCLADLVEMMTRSMKVGVSCETASKDVDEALRAVSDRCRAQGIKAGPIEIGRAVKGIMEAKLKDREGSLKIIGEKTR